MDLESDEIRTPNPDGWFYDGKVWVCRFPLWAENWPAMKFYADILQGQWRDGFNALDYNVLLHELDRRQLPRDEYDDLFGAIRVIESVAREELQRPA